jgi:hypothetical protein
MTPNGATAAAVKVIAILALAMMDPRSDFCSFTM